MGLRPLAFSVLCLVAGSVALACSASSDPPGTSGGAVGVEAGADGASVTADAGATRVVALDAAENVPSFEKPGAPAPPPPAADAAASARTRVQ